MKKLFIFVSIMTCFSMSVAAQYYPHHDPGKFWQCVDGKLYEFSCNPGLYFNPMTSACDWPMNVSNPGGSTEPPRCPGRWNDQDWDNDCHWYNCLGGKWRPERIDCTGYESTITIGTGPIQYHPPTYSFTGKKIECLKGDGNCFNGTDCIPTPS